jgi:hypothetical protein
MAESMLYLEMRNDRGIGDGLSLRKGQRWNMADQQMRIYHVGVHLVEFRMFKVTSGTPQQKLGKSSLETVRSVQDYLQKHQAVLGAE